MQGDFSQRLNSLSKKLDSCHETFEKHSNFLKRKVFSNELESASPLDIIFKKEKEAQIIFDNMKKIISEFDKIYKNNKK